MSVNQVDKQTGDTSRIAGGTLYADAPIGAILAFGGATAPAGWLLCQGQAISRTTYAALFAAIGTAFGAGDGSTTFNIPDLREATTKGAGESGYTVGAHVKTGGLAVGEFIDDRVEKHTHFKTRAIYASSGVYEAISENGSTDPTNDNQYNTGRSGDTTEVKAVGVNYIIKAQQVALPLDIQSEVDKKLDKKYLDTTGLDLDNCTESALYEINTQVANMPPGADGGNMIVSHNPSNDSIVQTYFATNGTIASRYRVGSNAWTDWNNRPPLLYSKNVQYTSDSAGNIVLHNSIDNVVIVSIRTSVNATWAMGYSPTAGYYIHLQDFNGDVLRNTTVNLDIVYYSYDWTAA